MLCRLTLVVIRFLSGKLCFYFILFCLFCFVKTSHLKGIRTSQYRFMQCVCILKKHCKIFKDLKSTKGENLQKHYDPWTGSPSFWSLSQICIITLCLTNHHIIFPEFATNSLKQWEGWVAANLYIAMCAPLYYLNQISLMVLPFCFHYIKTSKTQSYISSQIGRDVELLWWQLSHWRLLYLSQSI